MNWDYEQPVKILFGPGRAAEIVDAARGMGRSRGMLVSTPHFARSGYAQQLLEDSDGLLVALFSELSPNPDVTEVDACAAAIRAAECDFVVALGGGSALDLAKAAAATAVCNQPVATFHGTGVPVPAGHLPLIAVPTTSGTGSEVTCVSVLSDHALGKKAPIVSNDFYPDVAIIDPELTWSCSPYVTACTGIDVLSHAIEGYWSRGHQPICDALAIHAARLVFAYLDRAVFDGEDAEAREAMAEASVIAGLAFTLPKTTSSHACSFPLTNIHGIPHGEACGLTLDWFCRVNAEAQNGRVHALARDLGFADAYALAEGIARLKRSTGLRLGLADLELTEEQIADLVRISHHPNMLNNPVEVTDEMLDEMYHALAAR